jgi:nucleotide-binding universal stress UspA family protein
LDGSPCSVKALRWAIVQGPPAQVLLDAAAGAQMLVVGSRGHGTLAGMLLGSVSQHCVQHAPCPVVVIPPDEPQESRS